jgi:exodeoxyribonuclease VII small subunit
MSKEKIESKDLEKMIQELELIVKDLEKGQLPLEGAIERFEKGVALYNCCKEILSSAEKKIKVLTDSLEEKPY